MTLNLIAVCQDLTIYLQSTQPLHQLDSKYSQQTEEKHIAFRQEINTLPWDSYLHKQMIKKIITIRKPKRRILRIRLWRKKKIFILSTNRFCLLFSHRSRHHLTLLFDCNDPSFINFKLRLLNRSREYCLDAFLQSVPAFIITANSS